MHQEKISDFALDKNQKNVIIVLVSQPDSRGEKSTRKVRASQNRVLANGK